jgi:lysophospholipase L1-like esterase
MHPLVRRLVRFAPVVAFALFLGASCSTVPSGPQPSRGDAAKWEGAIAAFEAADRTSAPPPGAILFIGSSSIRMWTNVAQAFPEHTVINRGFGGSQIADVNLFVDRIVTPYRPRQIVFYCGGNDLNAKKTPAQVLADFREFTRLTRAKLPGVRISYISIAPNPKRWDQIEQVRAANALLARFCRRDGNMDYIDVHPAMMGADGLPKPDIFLADKLHMNAAGYALWREVVRPYLR